MFKILRMFRDTEDPEMGCVDGKAFETLSKSECLDIIGKYGVNGLELCRMGNIDPSPEFLCRLAFFTGQVCPEMGTSSEMLELGEPGRKKSRKEEKPTVSQFLNNHVIS